MPLRRPLPMMRDSRGRWRRTRGLGTTVQDLAGAITRFEGTCPDPSNCTNNNPGNLRAGPGSIGTDSRGIAIFPDYATGEAALERQVQLNVDRGLTLNTFFAGQPGVYAGYAPSADSNNPARYAATVGGWLGVDPNTPLSSVLSGETTPILDVGTGADTPVDTGTVDTSGSSGIPVAVLAIAAAAVLVAIAS